MTRYPTHARVVNVSIAMGAIDTVAVILRLLARKRGKAAFAIDDFVIVFSLIPLYGMIALGYLMSYKGGLGTPITTLTSTQLDLFMKAVMAGLITYALTITVVKISILALYRRIFDTPAFKQTSLIVGLACIAWFIVTLFTDVFQCRPFEAAFDPALMFTYHCIDLQAYYYGICAANLAIDLIMLYLPLHMVWRLQLPTRQKISLSGIFLLGLFACVASAIRISMVGNVRTEDFTLTFANAYLWSQIEPAVAVLCACLVTYRPLFANLDFGFVKLPSIFARSSSVLPSDEESAEMIDGHNWQLQSPATQVFHSYNTKRIQQLNSRAAKNSLHIVNMDLGSSRPRDLPSKTVRKGSISRHMPVPIPETHERQADIVRRGRE